jgi:hypothetical protein
VALAAVIASRNVAQVKLLPEPVQPDTEPKSSPVVVTVKVSAEALAEKSKNTPTAQPASNCARRWRDLLEGVGTW